MYTVSVPILQVFCELALSSKWLFCKSKVSSAGGDMNS